MQMQMQMQEKKEIKRPAMAGAAGNKSHEWQKQSLNGRSEIDPCEEEEDEKLSHA